ncbi:3681_t:CDS:2, partial [Ambispora gerdemannii]
VIDKLTTIQNEVMNNTLGPDPVGALNTTTCILWLHDVKKLLIYSPSENHDHHKTNKQPIVDEEFWEWLNVVMKMENDYDAMKGKVNDPTDYGSKMGWN